LGDEGLLFQNEFFDLFLEDDVVLLNLKSEGYSLKSFNDITKELPRIKLISFTTLKDALNGIGEGKKIGKWLPLIELTIAPNNMFVELVINETAIEIKMNHTEIIAKMESHLDKAGVVFGRCDLTQNQIQTGKPLIAAKGTEPIKGADAIITYIDRPERKPVIREDGSADYYEMNFVFPVNEGDWLGEKILPEEGISGTDVLGNKIAATRGKDAVLRYDRKSVTEEIEGDKVVLRAKYGGALEFSDDIVGVDKHLVIKGDIGPETGAVTFDGSVEILGTIYAGYSVNATGDVSINSIEGVTNAESIYSSKGDILIKGGVFGGGQTIIEAKGNIYLKHANNCKIYAEEVHAGLYLFSSDIEAKRIVVDKDRGKIIGGTLRAIDSIECAIVGTEHERKTILHASGVDKSALQIEIQEMALDLKNRNEVVAQLELHMQQFSNSENNLTYEQNEALTKISDAITGNKSMIKTLDSEIQKLLNRIKNAVPAQVEVTKEAFPGTIIQIGKSSSLIHNKTSGLFKMVDGVLNI